MSSTFRVLHQLLAVELLTCMVGADAHTCIKDVPIYNMCVYNINRYRSVMISYTYYTYLHRNTIKYISILGVANIWHFVWAELRRQLRSSYSKRCVTKTPVTMFTSPSPLLDVQCTSHWIGFREYLQENPYLILSNGKDHGFL